MLERYHQHFEALAPEAARIAWEHVHRRYPDRIPAPPAEDVCGLELLARVEDAQLDHAQVVLTMAPAISLPAIQAVETLVGRPIQRLRPQTTPLASRSSAATVAPPRSPRATVSAGAISATQVVLSVVPNPKKPGTSSHTRFAKYAVGMSVAQLLAAGITRADLKWDTERSFVVLGDTMSLTEAS